MLHGQKEKRCALEVFTLHVELRVIVLLHIGGVTLNVTDKETLCCCTLVVSRCT